MVITKEELESAKAHLAKVSLERFNRELIIDLFNVQPIESALRWMLRSDDFEGDLSRGLMFRGVPGSGKTHLLRCIAASMPLKRPMVILNTQKLVDDYLENANKHIAKWRVEFALGLDDLGSEEGVGKRYGNTVDVIGRLHEDRYDASMNLPLVTLCTTNLGREGLLARYGERCYDRMQQMYQPIVMNRDESFRKSSPMRSWAYNDQR